MNEVNKIAQKCIGDELPFCLYKFCMKNCEFLKSLCANPRELAKKFKAGYFKENPKAPYSCNVCDLCQTLCPQGLNVGIMCMEIRRQMVEEGLGPLPSHRLVRRDQDFVTSDAFALTQPVSKLNKCKYAFFPGCSLSGYSPELVAKTHEYLVGKLPGTGIILGCCGGPTHFLGDQSRFDEIQNTVENEMKRLGASELLVACPDCYHTIKHNSPDIKLRSIYEVMAEQGLPESAKTTTGKKFSLHDSCKTRWEKNWQDSVRTLTAEMGHEIEEMEYSREKTRCCGMGGMVPYADLNLAGKITKKRADEASYDLLTYCAGCREAFAFLKPSIHILDLIFNSDWEKNKSEAPKTGKARRENQTRLKALILEKFSGKQPKE